MLFYWFSFDLTPGQLRPTIYMFYLGFLRIVFLEFCTFYLKKIRGFPQYIRRITKSRGILTKQGRIVHRSGLNNENDKNDNKNSLKSKMKDFIFISTMVKADIF